MNYDHKRFRAFERRAWKRVKPYFNWIITALPAIFAAILRLEPQTAAFWSSLVIAASGAQVVKDFWKEGKDQRRIQSPDFFGDYIQLLSEGVSVIQDINEYSVEAVQFMEKQTLQTICDMVALYYKEHKETKFKDKFNANIMIPVSCQYFQELKNGQQCWKTSVMFFDPNRNVGACSQVLYLTDWAQTPPNWQEFVLPIDDDDDYLLMGAPRAYAKDEMQVCSDTLASEHWGREMSKHATKARQELRNYFQDNETTLRSFFSLPLHAGDEIVGILNVQSKELDILGVDAEHRDDLEMCLRPFCSLLAALIVRENSINNPA